MVACFLGSSRNNTNGYVQGLTAAGSGYAITLFRIVGGSACYLGQLIGSVLLLLRNGAGIYVGAIALVVIPRHAVP
jgi:hypothetical protein